ncbi:MAG: hypothetical protein AAFO01_11710 [Pseudomonadota bacterium]
MAEERPVSRDEMNARLEAVEARMDARMSSIDSNLGRISDQLTASATINTERYTRLTEKIGDAKQSASEAASAARGVKWNIVATGLTVAGVLLAVFAIWVQAIEMTSGVLSAKETTSEAAKLGASAPREGTEPTKSP